MITIILNKIWNSKLLIVIGTVFFIFVLIHWEMLFGKSYFAYTYIGADTINNYLPSMLYVQESLFHQDIHFWNLGVELGTNSYLTLKDYLADPFSLIIILFFKNNLEYGLVYMQFLKAIFSSIFTFLYFQSLNKTITSEVDQILPSHINKETFNVSTISNDFVINLIATITYAFSSYFFIWGQHYKFGTMLVYFPLQLLAIEIFLKKQSFWLIILSTFLVSALHTYLLVINTIFIGFYLIARFSLIKRINIRKGLKLSLTYLYFWSLGFFTSAVFIFPEVFNILQSERSNIEISKIEKFREISFLSSPQHIAGTIFRTFFAQISIAANSMNNYWFSFYELPTIATSVFALLCAPFALIRALLDKKYIVLLVIILIILSTVSYKFAFTINAFTAIYFRQGYVYAFSLSLGIFFGMREILKNKSVDILKNNISTNKVLTVVLFLASTILIGALIIQDSYFSNPDSRFIAWRLSILSGIFFFLYFLILQFLNIKHFKSSKSLNFKYLLLFILSLLIVFELIFANYSIVNRDNVLTPEIKTTFNSYQETISSMLMDDIPWNRTQLKVSSGYLYREAQSLYIPQLLDSSGFTSTTSKHYINFLTNLEVADFQSIGNPNVIIGIDSTRPDLLSFLAHQYEINGSFNTPEEMQLSSLNNDNAFAYLSNSKILETKFGDLTIEDKDKVINKAVITNDLIDISEYSIDEDHRFIPVFPSEFESDSMKFEIDNSSKNVLILTTTFNEGWRAEVNGKNVNPIKVNYGLLGLVLEEGQNNIHLYFIPKYLPLGLLISSSTFCFCIITSSIRKDFLRLRDQE